MQKCTFTVHHVCVQSFESVLLLMLECWQAVQEANWEGGTCLVSVTFSTAWPNSWKGTAAHCDCDVHTTPDGLWVADSII